MFAPHFFGLCLAAMLSYLSLPVHAAATYILNVVKISDLRFGSMLVVAGGTLTVSPSTGVRSGSANVVTPHQINNSFGAAQFRVTGTGIGQTTYSVTLTATPNNVSAASISMALSAFVAYPDISRTRTTNCASISETINVGATLQLDTSQTPGSYTATVPIVLGTTLSAF
jgi:hypothetical protein